MFKKENLFHCVFVVLFYFSCSVPKESGGEYDSLASQTESNFNEDNEVKNFTIMEELRNQPVTIHGQKKTLSQFLVNFYSPDIYTTSTQNDSPEGPKYIITHVEFLQGKFFINEGKCEDRSLVLCSRGDFVQEEFYDLFLMATDANKNVVVADKLFFDGSQGQSSTDLNVSKVNLSPNKKCEVLQVASTTEGGDINLHRDEWVEFYIADGRSFHSVLKLQLEDTNIQGAESSATENQRSSSELRQFQLLDTVSKGLYDIKVNFTQREGGNIVVESEEIYRFDGEFYVKE
jgi:hypothetical protein